MYVARPKYADIQEWWIQINLDRCCTMKWPKKQSLILFNTCVSCKNVVYNMSVNTCLSVYNLSVNTCVSCITVVYNIPVNTCVSNVKLLSTTCL